MDKGRKTSIYLNPPLARLAESKSGALHEALYRGLAVAPLLVEEGDGFITHWYCAVPEKGARFKVLHDHWLEQRPPVREIYGIEITQEASA